MTGYCTGYSTTVRDFVKLAFKEVRENYILRKSNEEKAYVASCNHESYKIEVGKVLSVDPITLGQLKLNR